MTPFADLAPGRYTVEPARSEVGFVARQLLTRVHGVFHEVSGAVLVGGAHHGCSVSARIDMASVDTGNPERDEHLRSPDFFDVRGHPCAWFASTRVTPWSMTGELTVKDATLPVTFDLEYLGSVPDERGGRVAGFEASARVNRKDWGLRWDVAVEGGRVLVGDWVTLLLDVVLVAGPGDLSG